MTRLYSPAWPLNNAPIRAAMTDAMEGVRSLLEVASGPGQHCFDHAVVLDCIVQPTDRDPSALDSIAAWRAERKDARVLKPCVLDVGNAATWPTTKFDGMVAINLLHMVDLELCEQFFRLGQQVLKAGGRIGVYDCFTYAGEHVSASNAQFDQRLQSLGGGVHAIEQMNDYAAKAGFGVAQIQHLPANNQFVHWVAHQ